MRATVNGTETTSSTVGPNDGYYEIAAQPPSVAEAWLDVVHCGASLVQAFWAFLVALAAFWREALRSR